jgi:hypothetical protein
MPNVVFRSRDPVCLSTSWHLASSYSSYLRSLPPPNASRINALTLEQALPIQAAAVVFNTTHIGSSETAGLRKWTLHGGKSRLARQAQTSPSTSKPSTSAAVTYILTHLHPRLAAACQPRPNVTLSDLRHSFSHSHPRRPHSRCCGLRHPPTTCRANPTVTKPTTRSDASRPSFTFVSHCYVLVSAWRDARI